MVFAWYQSETDYSALLNNFKYLLLKMNLEEKKSLVIQLHKEGKTQREIAQVAHMSVRDISRTIRIFEGISLEEKSVETQALDFFNRVKNQ